jgi:RES domain-containing protein
VLAYRIADSRHAIFSGEGARLIGGRWNPPGMPVIYAAASFAGAVLEVLVHQNLGEVPVTHACVAIDIPEQVSVERCSLKPASWNDRVAARAFGRAWLEERRSCVLLVPSVILAGKEHNVLLNPAHPDFTSVRAGDPELVVWDKRLFPLRSR